MKSVDTRWWRSLHLSPREGGTEDVPAVPWWQNAIIYQISPWSFQDTDGDGKGDLRGIVERMDYIAALGVDAIWLTPIYESPMDDLGYDITDMRRVGSAFGDMDDFKALLEIAHGMNIKVILDQVWNHTSDRHEWFRESRASRDNPRADWYVWADAKEDGSPPNNWLSSFTGESAWHWETSREQFYLANFLASQPDLNLDNSDVLDAIIERAQFWLDLGIDGFRLDAVNFFTHDPQLRNNPERPDDAPLPDGVPPDNPLVKQLLVNSFNRDENFDKLRPIRQLVDRYPGVVTLGEVTLCEDSIELASKYVEGDERLHLAYHSGLLRDEPMSADFMRQLLSQVNECFKDGEGCWIVGNHDYGRLRDRWTGKDRNGDPYPDDFYRMIAALLLSLPGALCLWQGDELGLTVARIPGDIAEDQIRDPFGKALYPDVVGRDGSRTPMPWDDRLPHGGFSEEEPWLPVIKAHQARSVRRQHVDPNSVLNVWRGLLHWRQGELALAAGDLTLLDAKEDVLVFVRAYGKDRLLCIFNIGSGPGSYSLDDHDELEPVPHLGFDHEIDAGVLKLPPWGVFYARI